MLTRLLQESLGGNCKTGLIVSLLLLLLLNISYTYTYAYTHFFKRQLDSLAFSLRFWLKLSYSLATAQPQNFFKNSQISLNRVKINYNTESILRHLLGSFSKIP